MSRPETRSAGKTFTWGSSRLIGSLLLGVAMVSACDLDYPTTTWADPDYDHVALSGGFALTGPHDGAACSSCHAAGNFEVMFEPASNQDCVACHSADYETQHGSLGYPTTCLTCHNGQAWNRAGFQHVVESGGYELLGPHRTAQCSACHTAGTFEPKYHPADNQDCVTCHTADYQAQHADQGYPTTCVSCHDGTTWDRGPLDHKVTSGGFELWGIHTVLPCSSCHVPDTFEPRFDPANDQDCSACHG